LTERCLDINSSFFSVLFELGVMYFTSDDFENALIYFDAYLENPGLEFIKKANKYINTCLEKLSE
jgi:hypothetical protein